MIMKRFIFSASLTLSILFSAAPAQAQNLLERILANPKIQVLLGKPNEIINTLGLCKNPTYQRANAQSCLDAANADMVLKLPFEMRTVMSSSKSAQSMRDLCIAAQSTAQRDSYLCAELAKADTNFATALQGARFMAPTTNPMNDLSN
jgi:hypothetical protein